MSKGLVITYGSGEDFFKQDTFWVYVSSLRNVTNADCVMLTHEMPDSVRKRLEERNIRVVDFPPENILYILRDRHLAFWEYLTNYGHQYDYVVATDCKDVMFQRCPFQWMQNHVKLLYPRLDGFVILISEGFKMQRSGFACIEQFEFERDVQLPFLKHDKDRWVLNGGTLMGTPRMMQNLHFLLWVTTMKSIGRISDQATLNWLYYYLEQDSSYLVVQPQDQALCLTGEGVKEEGVEPLLRDGVLYNPLNEPYCLLHQWERLDLLREDILAQYLS